jgi:hypothetical protein
VDNDVGGIDTLTHVLTVMRQFECGAANEITRESSLSLVRGTHTLSLSLSFGQFNKRLSFRR